jgi:hypothetical protein
VTWVWFLNRWIKKSVLVKRLKSLGAVEGVDFGEGELEYKGVPTSGERKK